MSGAGKTTALRSFEDLGYFCVDNIPPQLIETFLQLVSQMPKKPEGVAFVCDVRSGALFDSFEKIWAGLKGTTKSLSLIFLDASDEKLLQRFNELRRQHPLALAGLTTEEAIKEERKRLAPLKELATEIVSTDVLSAGKLAETLRRLFVGSEDRANPTITLVSFGYKYGVPPDADFVFDSRFLHNPYYIDELKSLSGTDEKVAEFVFSDELASWLVNQIIEIIDKTAKGFQSILKMNIQVAIGCTGGKHRSVAIVEKLKHELEASQRNVVVVHRDIDKP